LEKKILVEIANDSPFIIKLCFTFQDEASLCELELLFVCLLKMFLSLFYFKDFGLEYCLNGDLLDYLKKHKNDFLNGTLAQFYSAEIVLALEYIHSKSIIHRYVILFHFYSNN
jgi:serine/threonine protein kinase